MSDIIDYQELFRSAPTPYLVLDPGLTIIDANDAYLAVTMRDRDDLVGRPVFAAFPDNPDDPAADGVSMLTASLSRVRRDRVVDVLPIQKYDIERPDGGFDTRYWTPVSAPIVDRDGRLRWILNSVEDVTGYMTDQVESELRERVDAEIHARRRLQRRNEALQAVVDSLEAAVIATDADGRPVLHNEAARKLVGDGIAAMPAAEWGERLHLYDADGRPIGDELPVLRALRGERVRDAEIVRREPGRVRRHFRVHSCPVAGQPGVAAVVAIHEITARRRAGRFRECELAIAKALAGPRPSVAELLPLIGTLLGWEVVEFWSGDDEAGPLRRTGRWADPARPDLPAPGAELPGRAWRQKRPICLPGLDPAHQPLRTALAVPVPAGPQPLGVLICYSEAGEVPGDLRIEMVSGIGPPLGVHLVRRRAERLAADLDRAHDQYIALVGHELRTPLTSIQAYTDLLLEEAGLTGDQRDLLEVVQRNAAGLHAIVVKLLDVAALRAGRLDVRPQPMDLAVVLREAAGSRAVVADVPDTAPIDGDPVRLRQVVDELLANASTWAAEGTPVELRLTTGEHTTTVTVSDTGVPIRADERDRLFDLFYRGVDARHRGIPGAGLGLSLGRAAVEQHGGAITVSAPGSPATTFTVTLPTRRR